jgi:hypothetical protein
MADSGRAVKAVVKKMIEDIKFFSNAVNVESGKMLTLAQNLQSQWNDPQYRSFLAFMENLTSELKKNTKDLEYVAQRLEERELKEI